MNITALISIMVNNTVGKFMIAMRVKFVTAISTRTESGSGGSRPQPARLQVLCYKWTGRMVMLHASAAHMWFEKSLAA